MSDSLDLIRDWHQQLDSGQLTELAITDRVVAFDSHFANWNQVAECPVPVWFPRDVTDTNLHRFMQSVGMDQFDDLKKWWQSDPDLFWSRVIGELNIRFKAPPEFTVKYDDPRDPQWLPGSQLNIVDSCFNADASAVAIRYQQPGEPMQEMSYGELQRQVHAAAMQLQQNGFVPGDAIAMVLPMHVEAVIAYLAIVLTGCSVVSIADSFAAGEIAKRIRIAGAKAVVFCESWQRLGKKIVLGDRIRDAIAQSEMESVAAIDVATLLAESTEAEFTPQAFPPDHIINILFSSGTTGDPKAIPWTQTTPIKCAADGLLHHDIRSGDVVVWPTNTGWMMGPWLIFASLINGATIGLFGGSPSGRPFGTFVQDVGTTMLGVVPALVRSWRQSGGMEGLDWSSIRCFSSTGEASNENDMKWLSASAGFKPIIEYCGGTEIGGGYISSTMLQPNIPAAFSTEAIGSRCVILDDDGVAADEGELYLVPPSIGLSTKLLNRDHFETYYANVPENDLPLRRHGDRFVRLRNGYFRAGGRTDDTMNPGGIKIGSSEIESVINVEHSIAESAVIAVTVDAQGESCPDRLILFAVLAEGDHPRTSETSLKRRLNQQIKKEINPLIRISEVHFRDSLPRTASNKIMRRKLRREFLEG